MKVNALFLVHYGLGNRLNYKKGFEKKFLALSATYFKVYIPSYNNCPSIYFLNTAFVFLLFVGGK